MQYRRAWMPGGTFFFTVNLADRRQDFLIRHISVLRNAFRVVRRRHPFSLDAIVVLPDHLHAIWTLPDNDSGFSMRWALIKSTFSRSIPPSEKRSHSRLRKGERGIWQRRFWEHRIRHTDDLHRHIDYIHRNPLKHGYVDAVSDWPWSSFHRFVRQRILSPDWGGDAALDKFEAGERGA